MIEFVVKTLVDSPEAVSVTATSVDSKDIFEIKVQDQDIGKVIGKEGQTIRALRMLIGSLAPEGKEVDITIAK